MSFGWRIQLTRKWMLSESGSKSGRGMMVGGMSVVTGVVVVASLFLVPRMRPVMSASDFASSQSEIKFHVIISKVFSMGNSSMPRADVPRRRTRRVKRQAVVEEPFSNKDVSGFSDGEKRIIVDAHNNYRMEQKASDMHYMYWDDVLADFAQSNVEKCKFQRTPHQNRSNIGGFDMVGENLFVNADTYDPAKVVKAWQSQSRHYCHRVNKCYWKCDDFKQVTMASSYLLGCGVKYCTDSKGNKAFLVSCVYGPMGDLKGRPFEKGQACSSCPEDFIECVDKMCAKFPIVGASPPRGLSILTLIGCCAVSAMLSWVVV